MSLEKQLEENIPISEDKKLIKKTSISQPEEVINNSNTSSSSLSKGIIKSILKRASSNSLSKDSLPGNAPTRRSLRRDSIAKVEKKTTFNLTVNESDYDEVEVKRPQPVMQQQPARQGTVGSVIESNKSLIRPIFLNYKQKDLETEFTKYFVKFNAKRWLTGLDSIFGILTGLYLFLILQSYFDYSNLKDLIKNKNKVECPANVFCRICPPDAICTDYYFEYDIAYWSITILLPYIIAKIMAKTFYSSFYSDYNDLISVFLVFIQIFVGVGIRFYVLTSFEQFLEPTIIMVVLMAAYIYSLRIKFIYTAITTSIIAFIWTAINIIPLILTQPNNSLDLEYSHRSFVIGSVFLIILSALTAFVSYETEYFYRMQFLMAKEMKKNNTKLSNQLKLLAKSYNKKAGSLESPLERFVMIIRSIMADPNLSSQHLMALGQVLTLLNSTNLLAPDLEGDLGEVLDNEQQAWLFSEIASRRKGVTKRAKGKRKNSITFSNIQDFGEKMEPLTESLSENERVFPKKQTFVDSGAEYPPISENVNKLLVSSVEYDWPIFEFAQATNNHSLVVLSLHLFESANLMETFSIPQDKLRNFLLQIEKGYHSDLPYHNSTHATDVLHCMAYLANTEIVSKISSDIDVFAMYFAAIVHDHDHPGYTNNFLVATHDPKALLYNDKAVLESHHCASAFQTLIQPEYNFLAHLSKQEFKSIREIIIDLVLATDLTQHFTLLSLFKTKISTIENFDPNENREDRMLLYKIMIKCSDVSNPSKDMKLYEPWVRLIMDEFMRQGDMEKQLGIPCSPYMDRDTLNVPSCQIGFIDYVVSPLFDALNKYVTVPLVIQTLQKNREHWSNLKAQGITQLPNQNVAIPIPPQ